jgi:hypothetical protein
LALWASRVMGLLPRGGGGGFILLSLIGSFLPPRPSMPFDPSQWAHLTAVSSDETCFLLSGQQHFSSASCNLILRLQPDGGKSRMTRHFSHYQMTRMTLARGEPLIRPRQKMHGECRMMHFKGSYRKERVEIATWTLSRCIIISPKAA